MEICTQTNVVPLLTYLSCYNVIDKAKSIISNNTETGIISYVPLYLFIYLLIYLFFV